MSINLTAQEAADDLGISRSGVLKLITRKRIAATKHGRDWVITTADLHQYNQKGPLKAGRKKKTRGAQ